MGDHGFVSNQFNLQGVVYVPRQQEEKELDADSAMELAIEAGAEDVQEAYDDDRNPAYQVSMRCFNTV